jgi:hypothetical protein
MKVHGASAGGRASVDDCVSLGEIDAYEAGRPDRQAQIAKAVAMAYLPQVTFSLLSPPTPEQTGELRRYLESPSMYQPSPHRTLADKVSGWL